MLSKEKNALITRTDAGTPGGDLLRRYWNPVALSSDVTPGGKPKQLKIMGEDLVLFRDDHGRPGLLGLHCSHRLTSLAYGRVEDGGIRCPFHGWLYNVDGGCLDQPAEPDGSTFKDRVQHPAYLCQELGGLMFAYMGPPDYMPVLPRYEVLARDDGTRSTTFYPVNCNWLQNLEGVIDTVHFPFLHSDNWSTFKRSMAAMPKPTVRVVDTDYGIRQEATHAIHRIGKIVQTYTYFIMPTAFLRVHAQADVKGTVEELGSWHVQVYRKYQSWYTPIDDTHTLRFQVGFASRLASGEPYVWPAENEFIAPAPGNDYFRDYDTVDTLSGIPWSGPGTGVRDYLAQDSMANESQGDIEDRSREHLTAKDRVLIVLRNMLLEGVCEVQKGRDPKHIIREPHDILFIRGPDEMENG